MYVSIPSLNTCPWINLTVIKLPLKTPLFKFLYRVSISVAFVPCLLSHSVSSAFVSSPGLKRHRECGFHVLQYHLCISSRVHLQFTRSISFEFKTSRSLKKFLPNFMFTTLKLRDVHVISKSFLLLLKWVWATTSSSWLCNKYQD